MRYYSKLVLTDNIIYIIRVRLKNKQYIIIIDNGSI